MNIWEKATGLKAFLCLRKTITEPPETKRMDGWGPHCASHGTAVLVCMRVVVSEQATFPCPCIWPSGLRTQSHSHVTPVKGTDKTAHSQVELHNWCFNHLLTMLFKYTMMCFADESNSTERLLLEWIEIKFRHTKDTKRSCRKASLYEVQLGPALHSNTSKGFYSCYIRSLQSHTPQSHSHPPAHSQKN